MPGYARFSGETGDNNDSDSSMKPVDFLYGIHNHQPVGNFGHVFEESFATCYEKQLDILMRHPHVKMALHHSGPLFEWIESNRPAYIDTVARLVDAGQVEILSGGFYEPILSVIPKDDAIGQIAMMNDYVERRFGVRPAGMWTAERIWDPELPSIAAAAGIRFTLLDDTHFYYAGMRPEDRYGYYVTEKGGNTLSIFPIDMAMRYAIPFKSPDENIDYFRSLQADTSVDCVTYGDDGEKFGVWPDTYEWVYEKGWLDNFYRALEEHADVVATIHFTELLAKKPPKGRIYLPPASYEEMMEWTLPAASGETFHEVIEELTRMGKREAWKPFIRGGQWVNFQTKYDESNRMHKKMLAVSKKLADAESKTPSSAQLNRAKRELYRGQCNCAYWHGLFGGLYLNYLRHAVYGHLIRAERLVDEVMEPESDYLNVVKADYDMDAMDDVVMGNALFQIVVDPDYGATLLEADYRPADFCLTNTLTRQREAYHTRIENHTGGADKGTAPASIHDIVRMKEEGLADWLVYDKGLRRTFQDRFVDEGALMADYAMNRVAETGDFLDGRYAIDRMDVDERVATLVMRRTGAVGGVPVTLVKAMTMNETDASVTVAYEATNVGKHPLTTVAITELNVTLLAVDADDRYWTGGVAENDRPRLNRSLEDAAVDAVGLADDFFGFEIVAATDTPGAVWRFPVYTVSQSEAGFEKTYQGSCLAFLRPLALAPGQSGRWSITLSVKKR
jgi:alpha-amylase